jgi:hypothetical protein
MLGQFNHIEVKKVTLPACDLDNIKRPLLSYSLSRVNSTEKRKLMGTRASHNDSRIRDG